jgi:hypothetical protein
LLSPFPDTALNTTGVIQTETVTGSTGHGFPARSPTKKWAVRLGQHRIYLKGDCGERPPKVGGLPAIKKNRILLRPNGTVSFEG